MMCGTRREGKDMRHHKFGWHVRERGDIGPMGTMLACQHQRCVGSPSGKHGPHSPAG